MPERTKDENSRSGHPPWRVAEEWFQFNYRMESESLDSRVNESFLEGMLARLESLTPPCAEVYWLALARVTELAMVCAGNYADGGEFAAAGDLLINPRLVLVHINGQASPEVKERHGFLTEQFAEKGSDRGGVVRWLSRHAQVEVRSKPLLSNLMDRLEEGGYISDQYLDSLRRRAEKVTSVVSLLASGGMSRADIMSSEDLKRVEDQLCRFDRAVFADMGRELHQLMNSGQVMTRYLRPYGACPTAPPTAGRPRISYDQAPAYN